MLSRCIISARRLFLAFWQNVAAIRTVFVSVMLLLNQAIYLLTPVRIEHDDEEEEEEEEGGEDAVSGSFQQVSTCLACAGGETCSRN